MKYNINLVSWAVIDNLALVFGQEKLGYPCCIYDGMEMWCLCHFLIGRKLHKSHRSWVELQEVQNQEMVTCNTCAIYSFCGFSIHTSEGGYRRPGNLCHMFAKFCERSKIYLIFWITKFKFLFGLGTWTQRCNPLCSRRKLAYLR